MAELSGLLRTIYDRLLTHFGPQHWWPGESPFEVMVGAILTQNTNWQNVERALANLKRHGVLSPHALAQLAPEMLAELIRPAGYFNLKAKRLRHFVQYFVERYDGDVERMQRQSADTLRAELLAISGIGPETADSILLYALQKPIFVIDAYTARILRRHRVSDEEMFYDDLQALFQDHLATDVALFNEYHALLVATGKSFCRKTAPACDACPLHGLNWPEDCTQAPE